MPELNKKILFVSFEHFADLAYNLLKDELIHFHVIQYEVWNRLDLISKILLLRKYDIVHSFWAKNSYNDIIACRLTGTKYINHYIGSDVLHVTKGSRKALRKALTIHKYSWKTLADSENLIEELKCAGIDNVGLLQIFFYDKSLLTESSDDLKEKSVLTYIPEGKEDFYGLDFIVEAAKKFPLTKFIVSANSGKYENMPANIVFLGWVNNIDKYLEECFIYIRNTKHDGFPTSVMQALLRGKHVLCTQKIPFTKTVSIEGIAECLNMNDPNEKGRDFALKNYSKEEVIKKFLDVYKC